jgi:hypothetical protein
MNEEQIRKIIKEELESFVKSRESHEVLFSDRIVMQKNLQFLNSRNIQAGRTVGTKIGTADDQKIGFYGVEPVIQQDTISNPSGGATIDSQARTAINLLIDRLQAMGFIK